MKKISQTQKATLDSLSKGEPKPIKLSTSTYEVYRTRTLEALYSRGLIALNFPDKHSWRKAEIMITSKGLEALAANG